MSSPEPNKRRGRSAIALLAGFVAVVALSIGTDVVMHETDIFAPWGQSMSDSLFAVAFAYRTLYGILGGYIVARLAPNRPMEHALLSGAIGLILSLVGVITTWDKGPEYGPKWYSLALVVTAIPYSWAGAKLLALRPAQPRADAAS